MPMIHVVREFRFQSETTVIPAKFNDHGVVVQPEQVTKGEILRYVPGVYEVSEAMASHWYIQPFLDGYIPTAPPPPNTPLYATQVALAQQAVRMATPVSAQMARPAQDDVPQAAPAKVASRSGMVAEGSHYFAGEPQVDRPMPGQEPGVSWGPGVVGAVPQHAPPKAQPVQALPDFPLRGTEDIRNGD